MIRWWISALQLAELFVSSMVHLLYGFYVYSSAVAGDLSQALNERFFNPNASLEVKREDPNGTNVDDLPPIVLIHGIFGFGKGKFGGFSYFAGAEKKDERVLVPDLGSLTSVYDRARELFYYLKGGRVDYGEEHSKICGHSQFGRIYEQGLQGEPLKSISSSDLTTAVENEEHAEENEVLKAGGKEGSMSSTSIHLDISALSISYSNMEKDPGLRSYLVNNRFRVYPCFPDIAFPEGITVLPIIEDKWVAVSLEFPNERDD